MSDPQPPPNVLVYDIPGPPILPPTPAPLPPGPQWPGYVAWAVILLVVGFIIASNLKPELKGRDAPAKNAVSDLQIGFVTKTMVAARQLGAGSTTAPTTRASARREETMASLDKLVKTPEEKVRAAIAVAEIEGAEEALPRLAEIEKEKLSDSLTQDISDLRTIYTTGQRPADDGTQLTTDLGYFGRLALSYGRSASDPVRRVVLRESNNILVLIAAVVIGGAGMLIAGISLFIAAIVLLAKGSIRRQYIHDAYRGTIYVEMFAVWLLSYVLISLLISRLFGKDPSLGVSWLLAFAVPAALAWGIVRGIRWRDLQKSIGWHDGKGWHIEIPLGIVGYLAGLPIILSGILLTLVFVNISAKYGGAAPVHPIMGEPTGSGLGVLLLYSIASVFAPVIEETMFRGVLLNHMRRKWSWLISALVVAFIFAIIHPQGWTTVPALMSIAIVLAALREWRGSLLAPMVAHAFHNGMLVTLLVLVR